MAGTIVAGTLSDGTYSGSVTDTVRGACKAWVNFNGAGTVAIRASYNVSSITDNGTGDYTVNFTTSMPDANYTWAGGAVKAPDVNAYYRGLTTRGYLNAAYVRLHCGDFQADNSTDSDSVFVSIHR